MSFNTKSLFSLRSWLFYAEVLVVIGFVVLAFFYIRRGSAESGSPPVSQVGGFVEKADTLFAQQYLVDAALFYWQALQALEESDEVQKHLINGNSLTSDEVRLHANLHIAAIYSQSGWQKDAKARLEEASRIQPNNANVRLLRGKLLRDDYLLSEATEEFLAVVKEDPNNAEAHYLLGVLYQGSQQFEQAEEYYKKAIENDPELREVLSEKAPIGILARLQLSRTYSKMLQKYRFLDREYTIEDFTEVTRLESEAILLLEQALEKRPGMDEVITDLVGLLFAASVCP